MKRRVQIKANGGQVKVNLDFTYKIKLDQNYQVGKINNREDANEDFKNMVDHLVETLTRDYHHSDIKIYGIRD